MFQFFTSFAASTTFEKYRLEITTKTFDAPTESALKSIINTFSSNDTQTKAQIAYATIIKKLLTSDSKNNWLYILKNLLILDKIVEENLFFEEISTQVIPTIDNFTQTQQGIIFDSQRLIKKFWRLTKQKSKVLKMQNHIFCFKRSHRSDYLSKLSLYEILNQIQSIEIFFILIFQLIDHISGKSILRDHPQLKQKILKGRLQFNKSKLLEYINIQMLNKLILYYSCQLLCSNSILLMLTKQPTKFEVNDIKRFKKALVKFNQNSKSIIMFVQQRKHIKGFEEINYKELNPFDDNVQKLLDEIIDHKSKEHQQEDKNNTSVNYYSGGRQKKMTVEIGLLTTKKNSFNSRIKHKNPQEVMKLDKRKDIFLNWNNSYSDQFPQKEVMTVDLIMSIKNQKGDQDQEQIYGQSMRGNSIFSIKQLNWAQFNVTQKIKSRKSVLIDKLQFSNVYSGHNSKWNS